MARSVSALRRLGRIRAAVIGDKISSVDDHVRALGILPDYELMGSVRSPAQANETGGSGEFGNPFEVPSELISRPDVDLIAIVGRSAEALHYVHNAIAAGKDVYCDWPIATSSAAAAELASLAHKSGIRHFVRLECRVSQANFYVLDLLTQGYLGEIRSVHLSATAIAPPESAHFSKAPPTVPTTAAMHFLDGLFSVVGWPRRFSCLIAKWSASSPGNPGTHLLPAERLSITGTLRNDAIFAAHFDRLSHASEVRTDIIGDRGRLRVTYSAAGPSSGVLIEGANEPDQSLQPLSVPRSYGWLSAKKAPSSAAGLAELYAAFAQDLHEGTDRVPTLDDGVKVHKLAELMVEASNKGASVEFR